MEEYRKLSAVREDTVEDYQEELRVHRRKKWRNYAIAFCGILLLVVVIRFYLNNRSYEGYSVISTTERTDAIETQYEDFAGKILKYSKNGLFCTNDKNHQLFNITYTMQDPRVVLNEKAGIVLDKGGKQIFVFDQQKQLGMIETIYPIQHAAVSNQGVVAVLMDAGNWVQLGVYSSDNKLLGGGEFTLDDAGYPMDISISSDGKKFVISFAQVEGSMLKSCIAVYNFDDVGASHIDHLVYAHNDTEYMIPEVHYFDDRTFAAVGDGILAFFVGSEIPELTEKIVIEETIESIFFGDQSIGLVTQGESGKILRIYNTKGKMVSEIPFDLDYENIRIEEEFILIYNSAEMAMYTYRGKECFHESFETLVEEVFTTESRDRYLLICTNETQLIKLN